MQGQTLSCIQGGRAHCPGRVHAHGAGGASQPSHAGRVHAAGDAGPPGASVLQELAVKRLSGRHRSILAQLLALLLLEGSHGGRGGGRGSGGSSSHSSSSRCLSEVRGGPCDMGGEAQTPRCPRAACTPGAEAGAPGAAPAAVRPLLHVALAGTTLVECLLS